MKVSRQPRVTALLRIFAGTWALLWFVGIAVFGMGRVCNCAGHEGACAAHASPVHEQDAEAYQHTTASQHHDGAAPQGHCGKNGCQEQCRCSTMMAPLPTANPVVIADSISQQVFFVCLLNAGPEHGFAAPNCEAVRQAKPRDWAFTPEVCLGPAHRSHAPPFLA